MLIILGIALVSAVMTFVLATKSRRTRHAGRNPLAQVFPRREFRQLDAHLEAVARKELRHLEAELAHYLAGSAGHVVVVSKVPNGIALELSDGRRLALHGISARTVGLLKRRAPADRLRPESFHRDALTYGLLLRGPTRGEVKIYARNIVLSA
ncbi:MAG: hypothetical protein QOE19_1581 [Actinomycetota bacterium]|jgi:hypothetical protein|nr:hypothetical protein [Actinomycetota bacterium]MDQ1666467.1 hypothetical protein [Actinomycetota bacterium]MDQ1671227.1 hypothetical protein [Actinomycetota bacterium]